MAADTVLVLTHPFDPTADMVVEALYGLDVPVFRCDPGQFPQQLGLAARFTPEGGWCVTLTLGSRSVALDDIGCAYYRRPTGFAVDTQMSEPEQKWARTEARAGFGGLLTALPNWLNHPTHIAAAEYKPGQLQLAAAMGMWTAPSLLTNDPAQVRGFVREYGQVVYKPLAGNGIAEENTYRLIYANPVDLELDHFDDSIRRSAHFFQAWVDKAYEVRVTVVDETMFGVRIDAASAAGQLDWRSDYDNLTYTPVEVPEEISRALRGYLRVCNLRFGAADFIVTPDDKWVFLECNPNGQWAWLEEATGLPIAATTADALRKG
jgi:ATP-grasp ribosomal peptide maturase